MSEDDLTLAFAVERQLGFVPAFTEGRFASTGWSYEGSCSVARCVQCGSIPLEIWRKPWRPSEPRWRDWAIVCTDCKTAVDLQPFSSWFKKKLRAWTGNVSSEAAPDASPSSDSAQSEPQSARAEAGTSVPALVEQRFGVIPTCAHARFAEDGWTMQGVSDVFCAECGGAEPFIVYRKPYSTSQGDYRYWAVVCLRCATVSALVDFDKDGRKLLRAWDAVTEADEVDAGGDRDEEAPGDEGASTPVVNTAGSQSDASRASGAEHVPEPRPGDGTPTPVVAPPKVESEPGDEAADRSTRSPAAAALALALRAARVELEASKGSVRVIDVGPARRSEVGPQVTTFRVASPNVDLTEQPGAELFLATAPDEEDRVSVSGVSHASRAEAVVLVAGDVPDVPGLHLYSKIDPAMIPEAFVRALEGCASAGLAAVLAGGSSLRRGEPADAPDLNPEQRDAVGAVLAPGVTAIWGPPGTGKTRVIGAAVARILAGGRSVVVVSNTNVAVDQALLHVVRETGDREPGRVVRIGNPSIPEVADHPTLPLRKAVQSKHEALVSEMSAMIERLNELRTKDPSVDDARRRELLRDRTVEDLEALAKRHVELSRVPQVACHLGSAEAAVEAARQVRDDRGGMYDRARQEASALAEFDALLESDRAASAARDDLKQNKLDLLAATDELAASARGPRLLRRREARRIQTILNALEADSDLVRSALSTAESELSDAAALGVTPQRIHDSRDDQARARRAWEDAARDLAAAMEEAGRLRSELATLEAVTELTEIEAEVVAVIDLSGSPQAALAMVQSSADAEAERSRQMRELSSKIESIQRQLADLTLEMIRQAPVVGTTLAQLVLNQGLAERSFDYVVIDEASAALPPYAFAALTKATFGAAVVGDFEQNAPISHSRPEKLPEELRPWLATDPFALLGVGSAGAAEATSGCITLQSQYRFGDVTMALANSIAYAGLLRHGRTLQHRDADDPELVLVDTSSLADAAHVERGPGGRGRWWAAGTAVAFAVAQRHGLRDVGVITPYRAQAQLTRSRMADAEADVQVGTAHAFQGREFPTVVLDLVEDGAGQSWVARGDRGRGPWPRAGVRLFNVAVTRNSHRIYIVGSLGAVHGARTGPLLQVRRLLDETDVSIWDARALVEDREPDLPQSFEQTPDGQLLNAAQGPPTVLDGQAFYDSFTNDVAAATDRVVIFSPFITTRRIADLRAVLTDAVARGVRVTAFTKDRFELSDPSAVDELAKDGVIVKHRRGMHEKVVIIDDDFSYVGSLNVVSGLIL